jgi:hypothetical protein
VIAKKPIDIQGILRTDEDEPTTRLCAAIGNLGKRGRRFEARFVLRKYERGQAECSR